MTPWKHNTPPHRSALNFSKPNDQGVRWAKHAKGNWQTFPIYGQWRAWRTTVGNNADLGLFPTEGLAMSACARDCKDQP